METQFKLGKGVYTRADVEELAALAGRRAFKLFVKLAVEERLGDVLANLDAAETDEEILPAARDYKLVKSLAAEVEFWPTYCGNLLKEEKEHHDAARGTEEFAGSNRDGGWRDLGRPEEDDDGA